MAKNKGGRPTKAEPEKKKKLVKVGLNDAQFAALTAAAEKDGMDLSAFARHWMIERARALGIDV
jgi:hypothetical protein